MKKILMPILMLFLIASATAVSTPVTRNYLSVTDSANLVVKSTNYDPSPAEPGKYVTVWVTVQNLGNEELKKSWLKLEAEYPFSFDPGVTGVEEVDLISQGREELLEYDLRVDDQAIEGTYDLEVILCEDSACQKELRKSVIDITVKTGGKPKLEIGLESSDIFLPGTLGEITISTVNRGKLGIKFLTIEVTDSDDYEIVSPARVYIGELKSDDFETEDFKIYVKPEVSGATSIPIKVEYSDENYKDYSGVENVEIKIFTKEHAEEIGLVSGSSTNVYLIFAIIILLLSIFFYRRRKKKKDGY